MNKSRQFLACLLLFVILLVPETVAGLVGLSAGTFPAGTLVVPMDSKQADRIHVYGLIHEFLLHTPNSQLARIIEPPDVTLQTSISPGGDLYQGGPFLIEPTYSSVINTMLTNATFSKVTVTKLTSPFTSNRVFYVRNPTKILIISDGYWGKTYLTLTRMGISFTLVSTDQILANPSLINSFTLIVLDSPGWYGNPTAYAPDKKPGIVAVYNTIRTRVQSGNEVMYTDAAILDLNSTFPGYIQLGDLGETGSWKATVYNPSKGGFDSEFPSQYYNPGPNPNSVTIFTEEGVGKWVPTGVQAAHTQDVRILMDTTNSYGIPKKPYDILAFYFPFGNGIVEGLALQPYEQLYPTYADYNGYYAVYEIYGNKFVEGPQAADFSLTANPTSQTVNQGQTATYTLTVTPLGEFTSTVNLAVTGGLPSGVVATIDPPSVSPSIGNSVSSTLTIPTAIDTPVGTYNITITGSTEASALPFISRTTVVTLTVLPAPADFRITANPTMLTVNRGQCGNVTVIATSLGNFTATVNLTLNGLPQHVTGVFIPNPITPPIGGTAQSTLQLCVQPNAPPANYTVTLVATSGSIVHTVDVVLNVPPPPPAPAFNPLIIYIVIALLLLSLALALLALIFSKRAPATLRPKARYVLPLPTIRCRFCGRIMPLYAVFCPFCGRPQVILTRRPAKVVAAGRTRNLMGFILSLISGILVLLNSAALLSPKFYDTWVSIFFWLPVIGPSKAFALGVIIGLTLILGSIMMVMGHGVIADIIIIPFAIFSLIIGGGFIAGLVLGIVAAILGALGR